MDNDFDDADGTDDDNWVIYGIHEIQIDGTTIIFFDDDDKYLLLLFKNSNLYATKFDVFDVVMVLLPI